MEQHNLAPSASATDVLGESYVDLANIRWDELASGTSVDIVPLEDTSNWKILMKLSEITTDSQERLLKVAAYFDAVGCKFFVGQHHDFMAAVYLPVGDDCPTLADAAVMQQFLPECVSWVPANCEGASAYIWIGRSQCAGSWCRSIC